LAGDGVEELLQTLLGLGVRGARSGGGAGCRCGEGIFG